MSDLVSAEDGCWLWAQRSGVGQPLVLCHGGPADGALDIRPRTAVDSLHRCLPQVRRTTLHAGHLPWVEDPDGFGETVAAFLIPTDQPPG